MKKGILLLNIGTPKSPSVKDVNSYLKRFLMDEDVITLPYFLRWILVNLIILPFRSRSSATKYQKIWTAEGSPLQVHMKNLSLKLDQAMNTNTDNKYYVQYGLAYSEPEIDQSIQNLIDQNVDSIYVVPLFPQYAQATTGSMIKAVSKIMKSKKSVPVKFLNSFYKEDFFHQNLVQKIQSQVIGQKIDHYVFSYHGLPVKQLQQTTNCNLTQNCSESNPSCEEKCYYHHCLETSRLIAQKMNLDSDHYSTTFQSRLGSEKWLEPSTEDSVKNFAGKNIAIACPSFIVDCLETLEEINIEIRHVFKNHEGKEFTYASCLNDSDQWIKDFSSFLKSKT